MSPGLRRQWACQSAGAFRVALGTSGIFANNLRLYTSLAHTPTPPESWLRLCLYAPVGTPATAPNFTPCASGPQAVTTATSAATTPAVIPSAKP
jgi:hypothetical protein